MHEVCGISTACSPCMVRFQVCSCLCAGPAFVLSRLGFIYFIRDRVPRYFIVMVAIRNPTVACACRQY